HVDALSLERPAADLSVAASGAASGTELVASAAELVVGVERRDLVALGECRIVEHGPEEGIDPAAQAQNRLADMDQLGRAGADRMDAEQWPVLAMEEHLEEPAVVAEDLAARDLSIARQPRLVRDFALGQLVLGKADHRDLRNRVDADGEVRRHRAGLDA